VLFAAVVSVAVGLVLLPRWRDRRFGPEAGALVLYAGAAVAAVLALVLS
jgi:hypothetical protein